MTYGLGKCARKTCGKPYTLKTHNQKFCSTTCQRLVHDKPKGTMHFGKVKNSPPMRRVLALLRKKRQTTLEIQVKARVCNPATWVSALRKNGFNIVCEYVGTDASDSRVYRYQLIKGGK